ncbi:MAG TPA: two-component regulator propeller domain-containing protein, partial [bacterium]|nr:two-component regulator propeller domain-containing protein [bacterium]
MRPLPLAWRPRVACALAALAFTASVACAQTSRNEPLPHYQFQRLTVADGLPENSITSLIQDRQGFLWFGTPNGLVRYDGREVKVFRQRSASRGAQLGAVTTVIEDARGGIWAGAGQDGLWHLDRRTGRWTTYQHDPRDEGSLSGSEVTAVVEAAPGRLLVVSRMPGSDPVNRLCIDRLDTRTGQVRHFRIRGASVNAPAGDCMLGGGRSWRDARGRVWLGSGSGAFRYDPRTDSLLRIPPAGGVPYGRDRYEALDAVFRQGRMLAAIRQPGNRVDQTVEFRLDRPSPVLIAGGGEIEQDYPYDYGWIENTRGDTVWAMRYGVSAWMGGNATNRLVVATRTLPAGRYRLRYHSDWAESMEGWVAAPERPDLWGIRIAVLQAGAVRDAGRLETRPLPPRGPRELPNTSVQVLGGDATGGMWFGFAFSGPTLNRGPLQYDPLTSHVAPVPLSAGPEHLPDFLRLTHARAISMLSAPGGVLWFGTDRGLYRLERGRATRYSFDAAPMGPLNQIREITDGGDGTLWLGVGQG